MSLPRAFLDDVAILLGQFAKRGGLAPLSKARSLVGKASRIAQVVPEATPFVGSLWAALVAAEAAAKSARPEAPPGRVAVRRFSAAAAWLLALVSGAVLPLRRVVHEFPDEYRLPQAPEHIEFDASPWGGGGVLVRDGKPIQYWHCTWPDSLCRRFGAAVGLPKWQTLWEYIAALVCLLVWADDFAVGQCLTLMGDNIGALTGAAHFRGRRELNAVTREISWRKAAFQWSYVVAHLPSEANDWADSLSRLAAVPPKPFPQALRAAQAVPPPALDVIWRTWVADCPPPAPTLTQLPAGEGVLGAGFD